MGVAVRGYGLSMTDRPTMIRVRFRTTRGALCGVHVGGMEYDLPEEFARQVVEQERVAEYVSGPTPVAAAGRPTGRRRAPCR